MDINELRHRAALLESAHVVQALTSTAVFRQIDATVRQRLRQVIDAETLRLHAAATRAIPAVDPVEVVPLGGDLTMFRVDDWTTLRACPGGWVVERPEYASELMLFEAALAHVNGVLPANVSLAAVHKAAWARKA